MANIEKQMEMFGYTAEEAKQEADRLAADVNTDLTFKEAATTVGSMLPGVGTAMTVAEIEDELKQENPNYGKIALLGGAEIVGLVPGLGTAAKSGLKAAAKRLGVDKLIKAIDAPKPEDAVKLEAGFTGTNPPTYEPRVDVKPKLTADEIFFRKPIMQFVRSLDVPEKGILGSNFSKLVEKNPSISPTSLQKQLINPKKRYSKKELEDIFKSNEFSTAAMPKKSPYKTYGQKQRQYQVGFRGGSEQEYFEIPIKSFTSDANIAFKSKAFRKLQKEKKEGKPELLEFKPKKDTHFGSKAIAHLRGSIINPRYHQNVESIVDLTSTHPEFDKIIKNENFLLVEELQSNLISGGFLKSNFNEIYDEAISTYDSANLNRYDRVFRTTDGNSDRKLRDLIQKIDKENPALPDSFIYKHKLEYGVKGEKLINEDGRILNRKEALSPFEFEDYLRDKLKSEGLEEIPRRNFEDFFAQYRKSISKRADTDSPPFIEYGQPPITKNKQAVEELIKVAIGKAANENVNYVVFPNVTRIKLAREKTFNPNDKGDLFYQTYFKQLNSALSDLEKNYPVKIYDNVNLPYDDKAFIQTMASTGPDVPNTYLETLRLGQSYRTPDEINEIIDSSGTVIDITDLVKKFKVEEPRQFAEGGDTVRPEPRPETRPFPDVKPKARPDSDEYRGRTYDIYSVELDGIETNVIEFKDGKKISAPQIRQMFEEYKSASEPIPGKQTSQEISKFLEDNNPTYDEFIRHFTAKRLNKGGMIGDQMQMAFMNEGGLTDDGMDVDPVSGNDIPSGSMAEEVRDDIPAQLSDGEYVVPADVVRYYGVKFFEDLRDRAKRGLAEMEANGRIGGEHVPEGGPINNEELSPEEMQAIQEMVGMSEGGQVRGYQDSSLVTGSQVESNMLGGQSPAQVEQQILSAGNTAVNKPYIGQQLGFSIFGDSNSTTQQTSQQPQTSTFTPIVLYNKAGQSRAVNSEEEKVKAIADGYTMTLEQYNMYRSQSGGSGSGGSTITPPGGEAKESKPWGQDVNWNNVKDIEQFVAQAERGNLSGSGRFLRGAGFAIAGLPGALLAGAFQVGKGLNSIYDMEAAKIIAEAKGHTELAKKIDTGIKDYFKTAGDISNYFYKPKSKAVMSRVNRYLKGQGIDSIEDVQKAYSTTGTKIDTVKGKDESTVNVYKAGKDTIKPKARPKSKVNIPSGVSGDDPYEKEKTSIAKQQEKSVNVGGPGFRNKGGLMTKGKKKK